ERNSPNALAVYDAIMLRFTAFVVGVHGAVLLAVLGLLSGRGWATVLVPLMLGLTVVSIGNLLPRTRPNLAIGIRTHLTLVEPCALDGDAPMGGICDRRLWRGHCPVGGRGASARRAGNDSPRRTSGTRGNRPSRAICEKAFPCLTRRRKAH